MIAQEIRIHEILDAHLDPSSYEYGFADLTGLLSGRYSSFRYGISLMRKLDDRIIDGIMQGPTRDYFDLYHSVNRELAEKISAIVDEMNADGFESIGVKPTLDDSELDEEYHAHLTVPVSHKLAATRAGLGWIGKTDLLVSRRFGPRVRLATILTKYPLAAADPIEKSLCGKCSVCVDICPCKAANGRIWNTKTHRNEFFDPFRCRDYCRTISNEKLNEAISLCGKCVSACPIGGIRVQGSTTTAHHHDTR